MVPAMYIYYREVYKTTSEMRTPPQLNQNTLRIIIIIVLLQQCLFTVIPCARRLALRTHTHNYVMLSCRHNMVYKPEYQLLR